MTAPSVRIGCAAGFWGDSPEGAAQLVRRGEIDVLVFDYLAEVTMSLLARIRAKRPEAGYVPDFMETLTPLLGEIKARGIKVVSNGGGMNPLAAAKLLSERAGAAGVALTIATVTGDDLTGEIEAARAAGVTEMFTGATLPERVLSANAYLGAAPIAAALDRGADIVITGRCVDSAVTLGALVHAFGWSWTDYDRLAQASLAGHLLECGAQGTGGIATDWQDVPGWDDMGCPIAECAADGSFVITKPGGTGGRVAPLTVAEQLLYEIGDPASYILPDVVCDFRRVTIESAGRDRVRVAGARGRSPTPTVKVSATYPDGFRCIGTVTIAGRDAAAKARRAGEAILTRTRRLLRERNLGDFRETSFEVLGAEATYGPMANPTAAQAREVVLKIGARHAEEKALAILAREIAPAAASMAQGLTGFFAGRPTVQPVVRLFSFLWPKAGIAPVVHGLGEAFSIPFSDVSAGAVAPALPDIPDAGPIVDAVAVPLVALAVGRSGDKGDTANIGIAAREPRFLPYIRAALTAETVQAFFAHTGASRVVRYDLPGLHALNFVLEQALGGGGIASLRIDPQGKAFAQMLMDVPIAIPRAMADELRTARAS